jgi:dihydroorotase-like cyclic amidohydrolase
MILSGMRSEEEFVTAETAASLFYAVQDDLTRPNKKDDPALRRKEDVEAERQALKNGVIDAIARPRAHMKRKRAGHSAKRPTA